MDRRNRRLTPIFRSATEGKPNVALKVRHLPDLFEQKEQL